MKMTGHKAHAAAVVSAITPATVMIVNKYAALGMDLSEQALVTAAIAAPLHWLVVYFVPNKEKAQ